MDQQELNENLERLRVEWKNADTTHRKLIEIRAKLLKKQAAEPKAETSTDDLADFAEKVFHEHTV